MSTPANLIGVGANTLMIGTHPHTKDRANSYDRSWKQAWVEHCRTIYRSSAQGKTAGFVLQIGDSLTHSIAQAFWCQALTAQTTEDQEVTSWMHARDARPGNSTTTTSKDGFYLAIADTTANRGMTASGNLDAGKFLNGYGNGGVNMPYDVGWTQAQARATLASGTYVYNIHCDTLIKAFGDAQFAYVLFNAHTISTGLAVICDKLEAANIVPVLTTAPRRFPDSYDTTYIVPYNESLRVFAQARSLPLIDTYAEMEHRQPGGRAYLSMVGADGTHLTGNTTRSVKAGYNLASSPYLGGGDPALHSTGDPLKWTGYPLKAWLLVQKAKELKAYVADGQNP